LRTKKRRLYWDSNCFIAVFNAEPTTPRPQLDALQATFEEMVGGQVKIITSDLYRAEVFGQKNDPKANAIAEQLEACPDFEMVPLRTQAHQIAGDMRARCRAAKRRLDTADALHVAAATLAKADEMWTTEPKLVNRYEDGLLASVRICFPYLKQMKIPF
jgi:predicted nucleic acid-binding protein